MQIIPINAIANQTLTILLANQSCRINVYQKFLGLFCDLYVNDVLIVAGVLCENANRIVRSVYLGFIGDLIFFDTQGDGDPYYTGLGVRYQFIYLTTDDLGTLGLAA